MEREMGFEPTTTTLATWRSTPELLPHHCDLLTQAEGFYPSFRFTSVVPAR